MVELERPLLHQGKTIDQVEIKPPRWDQQIRLSEQKITSMLGMLAEMVGLPERLLRELTYPDVDRVMLAFHNVLPPIMRKDFETGAYTLATPIEEVAPADVSDQDDPRFPKADGPVKKFATPPQVNIPKKDPEAEKEVAGLGIEAPEVMRPVN